MRLLFSWPVLARDAVSSWRLLFVTAGF